MKNEVLVGVLLHLFDQNVPSGALPAILDLQLKNTGFGSGSGQELIEFVTVQGKGDSIMALPIKDSRDPAGRAQLSCHALAGGLSHLSCDFVC